ncbi:MAG: hypothetical protein F8N36_11915 [Desulfovibrio sp.]|uniref:hypothetical protein n=1 Tax=Desulfovibrio sp. TaxID=885 RepID=UPI00135D1E6D|nr:hypothetical protein [Desulfovibrio sp.]MTJ93554.1 hypothetical protein [Desulfovibrio sp.]
MENGEAAAIASKESFDKSRVVMEGYGKALRGDSWWLASLTSICTTLFLVLVQACIGWIRN